MILVGFILVGAAVAIGIDIGMENTGARLSITSFGHTFSQPPWVVIVAGAVCGMVVVIGMSMMATGAARRRRRWLERRDALRQRDRLVQQLDELRADLDRAERGRASGAADAERVMSVSALEATNRTDPSADNSQHARARVDETVSTESTPPDPTVGGHHRRLLRR
jgi:biopolymer transport protein ExbB/TolQ